MSDQQGPIFIDQFGTGPSAPPPDAELGPWWKECWQGRMELWKAFWVCFVFGHGIIGGVGFGAMIVSMILGFAVDPGSLDAGFAGLATGTTLLIGVYAVFAVWIMVGVWRCADNCLDKRWGIVARVAMVFYGTCLVLPFAPLLAGTGRGVWDL